MTPSDVKHPPLLLMLSVLVLAEFTAGFEVTMVFGALKTLTQVFGDPIQLNTDPNVPTLGDQFTVIGMGFNSTNYTNADRLLKVQVRYVDHDLCQDQWELLDDDMYYNESKEVFDDSMFCAIGDFSATKGPTKGTISACLFSVADAVRG